MISSVPRASAHPYSSDAEVEVATDDPTRPLVSTVDTLRRAPYFTGLFSGRFAPLPQNAANQWQVRLPDFSRKALKIVLSQLRTGVPPQPTELRRDQRAEYMRLADYLGVLPAWQLVMTEPHSTLWQHGAMAMTAHAEHVYVATDEHVIWKLSPGRNVSPEEFS